ncbi:ABC transporter permease [Egibacter rhizosphaerae]|uniref:ABC transporter permease n=1 Tax=Egibacter rhizosphaerae TaxID=1670831 RepID=A0A411YHT4_9ACTN|nr:ABC transporter permease [Egibacter rhizosphaerae]QBI20800.1 ABC transporter permease [Egibacter rhizosphaerae]
MARMLGKRLVASVVTAVLATIVVFVLMRAVPGDVVQQMLGQTSDPDVERALRSFFGLDEPLYVQYGEWLLSALQGDLGTAWVSGQPVGQLIGNALLVTLQLTLLTLLLAVVLGVPVGLVAGMREGGRLDSILQSLTVLGLATPIFWLGIMLLIGVSAVLGWSPPLSYQPPTVSLGANLQMMVLPVLSLGVLQAAAYAQFVRQAVVSATREQYVITARAKGLPERKILFKHILRNILVQLITFMGLLVVQILGGAVVIESIFTLPGFGRLLLGAITSRDYPLLQGGLLVVVLVTLTVNLIIDLLYRVIDPRLRTVAS